MCESPQIQSPMFYRSLGTIAGDDDDAQLVSQSVGRYLVDDYKILVSAGRPWPRAGLGSVCREMSFFCHVGRKTDAKQEVVGGH